MSIITSLNKQATNLARKALRLGNDFVHPVSDEVWVEKVGQEILTPANEIEVGDTVVAVTGTVIPIDGIHFVTQARCVTECIGDL